MASCASNFISIVTIFLILMVRCKAQVGHLLSIAQNTSALFVFGDSILDCGTGIEAMFLPYGIDAGFFPGRYTNGYTIGDELGLYLNLTETYPSWVTTLEDGAPISVKGFCYASGHAGLLSATGSLISETLNMPKQIDMFGHDVKGYFSGKLQHAGGTFEYVSKSLFAIAAGSNDFLENFGNGHNHSHSGKSYSKDEFFSNLLISELQKFIMELYRLGARMIIVFEIGPIGCYPVIVGKDKPVGWCSNQLNDMVSLFNGKLYHKLVELSSTLEGTTFFIAKTFRLIYGMLESPHKYILDDGKNPCCKVNETEGVFNCIPEQQPCQRRDEYLFFDKQHLTSKANKLIASKCLTDSSICLPITYHKFQGTIVTVSGQQGHYSSNVFLCIFSLFVQLMIFTNFHYFG